MNTDIETPEYIARKKAEYDRWFERGKESKKAEFRSVIANMRPGSAAYEGFADGFASKSKKSERP